MWTLVRKTDWPPSVQHCTVTIFVIMQARPVGVSRADLALLLHVALGTHDSTLRAHDTFCYVWVMLQRYWLRAEGAFPYYAIVYLLRHMHRVEGLLRCFIGDVEQSHLGVIGAVNGVMGRRAADDEGTLLRFFQ